MITTTIQRVQPQNNISIMIANPIVHNDDKKTEHYYRPLPSVLTGNNLHRK